MGSEINDYVYRNSLGSTFPGHFLPTDPNVGENSYGWSTTASGADRKFGNFDELAPPVPSNWEIHIPWSAPGNEDVRLFVFTDFFFSIVKFALMLFPDKISQLQDADGWTYATDFNYLDWWPKQGRRMFVRRRLWVRQIVEREEAKNTSNMEDSGETLKIPVGFQVQNASGTACA